MIHRAQENGREVRNQMRGGKGDIVLEPLVCKQALPAKMRLFTKITVAPGCSIGKHVHEGEVELFYFQSGKGRVWDDDECVE
ncbi:MAG TPA: cupin domain-containing protein, partial [Clostridia bacterium]|nr:cupin domain-containing protein [Clostridia bacterium]